MFSFSCLRMLEWKSSGETSQTLVIQPQSTCELFTFVRFMILFMVLFCAFAIFAQHSFGPKSAEFSTLRSTLAYQMGALFGDIDYWALSEVIGTPDPTAR